jgi:hypothetical protein
MKMTQIIMSAATLFVVACNPLSTGTTGQQEQEGDNQAADSVASDTPPPPGPASDSTVQTAPPPPATPEPPQFAPPGVFYLVSTVSIQTNDGILGFKPGTQVVKQSDGSFIGNGHKLQLNATQMTNDLRVARQVIAADENAQNLLRQRQQQAAAAQRITPKPVATPPGRRTTSVQTKPVEAAKPPLGGSLGPAHTRVKDGYLWKRDADGQWVVDRPIR